MPLGIFHYSYDFHKCNFAWQTIYILNFKKVLILLFSQKQNFLCAVLTIASFFSSFFHFNVT